MFRNTQKRARRRAWPIHAYCGANGGGKSAAMVWDTLPTLEAGRPVLSTVRLLDYANPRDCEGCEDPGHLIPEYAPADPPEPPDDWPGDPAAWVEHWRRITPARDQQSITGYRVHAAAHPLWIPFTEWAQLLDATYCDVLMDEVTGVASSRESQSMPAPVANTLVQLRRRDVVVRWSAPSWARADKIIRECSQAVTYAEGFLPKSSGGSDRLWRNRRMFRWRTYDAADFEDFTAGKREQLKAMVNDWHWGPGSPEFSAYDTYDAVLSIGTVSDAGRCYHCGGRRVAPECSCPDYHSRRNAAKTSARQAASARPKAEHAASDLTGSPRTPLLVFGQDTRQ